MKKLLFLCLSCLTLFVTQSHAQTTDNPLFRNIPPDATTVIQVNLPVLTTRIGWKEFMAVVPGSKLPGSKLPGGNSSMVTYLKDPELAGVDLHNDFFIAEKNPTSDSSGYTVAIFHLSDSAKFRAALKKSDPGTELFSFPNKNKIRLAGKAKVGIAWDKNLAVIVTVKPSLGRAVAKTTNYALQAAKKGVLIIQGFSGSFYTTDPFFQSGFSDNADAHIWVEQGQTLSMFGNGLLKGRVPIDQYLQAGRKGPKMHTLMKLRMDDGKIDLSSTSLLTAEQKDYYTRLNSKPLNMDLQARIPPGNLMGLINFRFDPTIPGSVLSKLGFRNKVDTFLRSKGLPLDTLLSAFNGDFQLACMEPKASAGGGKPEVPLYFVTTIRSPSAFFKTAMTLKSFTDSAGVDSTTGKSRSPLAKLHASSTMRDNILVIAKSKEMTDGWFSNTERRSTDFLDDRIKENPISIYIDFKVISHFIEAMAKSKGGEPTEKDKKLLNVLHQIDRLEITGGALKGDTGESYLELKLVDSSPTSVGNFLRSLH